MADPTPSNDGAITNDNDATIDTANNGASDFPKNAWKYCMNEGKADGCHMMFTPFMATFWFQYALTILVGSIFFSAESLFVLYVLYTVVNIYWLIFGMQDHVGWTDQNKGNSLTFNLIEMVVMIGCGVGLWMKELQGDDKLASIKDQAKKTLKSPARYLAILLGLVFTVMGIAFMADPTPSNDGTITNDNDATITSVADFGKNAWKWCTNEGKSDGCHMMFVPFMATFFFQYALTILTGNVLFSPESLFVLFVLYACMDIVWLATFPDHEGWTDQNKSQSMAFQLVELVIYTGSAVALWKKEMQATDSSVPTDQK
jgi:hypothetical protein